MSEQEKRDLTPSMDEEEEKGSHLEDDDGHEDEEDEDDMDEDFKNNHDLIGVKGIIKAQKHEIDKKKVSGWHSLRNGAPPCPSSNCASKTNCTSASTPS